MQITFKLYATLSTYLPADAKRHMTVLDVPADTTPYGIIDRYQVPRERAHLVLLNGVYLSPEQCQQATIEEGDTLAVWPPIAGG